MHVVHDLRLRQEDDQVLGDKTDSLFFHLLGNPDTGILRHTKLAADDTDIRTVQVTGTTHLIGIPRGDGDLGEVGGDLLGIGIELLDDGVDVLTLLHFDHMTTHTLRHLDKLHQRVRVGDGLNVAQIRHVKLLTYVLSVLRQNSFFTTHNFSLFTFHFTFPDFHIEWNVSFGNCIIS